jgi:hypothetical protein
MTATAAVMAKEERVIPAARWLDVMYEQTQYLINHARMRERECPKGCGACRRLRDLERVLLQPFRKADEVAGLYRNYGGGK